MRLGRLVLFGNWGSLGADADEPLSVPAEGDSVNVDRAAATLRRVKWDGPHGQNFPFWIEGCAHCMTTMMHIKIYLLDDKYLALSQLKDLNCP